jgi:hypothetical protein
VRRAGVDQSVERIDYGLDDQDSVPDSDNDEISFSSPPRPDWLWPTQPPTQWTPRFLITGVTLSRRETDHSLHLVPRLRMHGTIHPLPQYVFLAWRLINRFVFMAWQRIKFTFFLYLYGKRTKVLSEQTE